MIKSNHSTGLLPCPGLGVADVPAVGSSASCQLKITFESSVPWYLLYQISTSIKILTFAFDSGSNLSRINLAVLYVSFSITSSSWKQKVPHVKTEIFEVLSPPPPIYKQYIEVTKTWSSLPEEPVLHADTCRFGVLKDEILLSKSSATLTGYLYLTALLQGNTKYC